MTIDNALQSLSAHVGPDFARVWRKLGHEYGYRQLGKAIARHGLESRMIAEVPKPRSNGRKNGHKNGRRMRYWWKHWTDDERAAQWEYDRNRYAYNERLVWPFTWSPRVTVIKPDETEAVLAKYEPRQCCGEPMGIMEAWQGTDVTAIYQCAVNPKHQEAAYPRVYAES